MEGSTASEPPLAGALLKAGGAVAGGVAGGLARRARGLLPSLRAANLDDRDTDYMREVLPGMWLLTSLWFRADVRGLHHIPQEGPVLLVGNHTGGVAAPEVIIIPLAFCSYFGVERPFYQLAHRLVTAHPALASLRKFGTIEADMGNAERALEAGAAVLVFPGGDFEVFRPSWESGRTDFGGRKGFLRLAHKLDVPIVPMVTIGGQETALFLSRGEWLAKLLRADKLLRLKTIPIAFALPFGLGTTMFGHVPLPAKVTIQALEPIDLRAEFGDDPDLQEAYDHVQARMQDVLTALAAERRLPVIG